MVRLGGLHFAPDDPRRPRPPPCRRAAGATVPRSMTSRARASARLAALSNSAPSRSRVWSAPITRRPALRRDTQAALASARTCATARGRRRPASRPALSHRPRRRPNRPLRTSTPAARSSAAPHGALRRQHHRGHARTSTWPPPAGHDIDHRRGGLLDRAAGDVDHRPAVLFEHPPGADDLGAHGFGVDVAALALLLEVEQPVAADLDQSVGRDGQAHHDRPLEIEQAAAAVRCPAPAAHWRRACRGGRDRSRSGS